MGNLLFISGIGLAAYAGYAGLMWYFIFISSLIMAFGYFIVRAPQIHSIQARDGFAAIPKLLIIQVIMMSIITSITYFIASALS